MSRRKMYSSDKVIEEFYDALASKDEERVWLVQSLMTTRSSPD